jgi:FtsZ-interacting cell division protein ZipA
MSSLQLGLIIAGVVLVIAVLIYNGWQERRARRGATSTNSAPAHASTPLGTTSERVEPTLRSADANQGATAQRLSTTSSAPPNAMPGYRPPAEPATDSRWTPPVEVIAHETIVATAPEDFAADDVDDTDGTSPAAMAYVSEGEGAAARRPDPDIECIVTLQPAKPIGAGALAAGLHARLGKRLRWFGRTAPDAPWQMLAADTRGQFVELAACMLLADRNGAASRAQLDTFARVISELAPLLPAASSVPDVAAEAERAEALDRLCADVDVQIGLTVLKADHGIPGTKLRGVAEAAGFRLASGGRFEWVQEDTGFVHYTLQNIRNEPFTVDTLRLSATNGVVFVLDVPRVADAARVFDHMKLAAKRLAHSLAAELVDDNRRPLDDASLVAIRKQVEAASGALRDCGIEPGSPRALALFGA